jgi:hypothetical protein
MADEIRVHLQLALIQFYKAMGPDRFGDCAHRQFVFIVGIVPESKASGATLFRSFTAQRQRSGAEQMRVDGIGNPLNRSRRTRLPEHYCQSQASHHRTDSHEILINDCQCCRSCNFAREGSSSIQLTLRRVEIRNYKHGGPTHRVEVPSITLPTALHPDQTITETES